MIEPREDRAPWEIPPDEGYWRALLEEGEYLESPVAPSSVVTAGPEEATSLHAKGPAVAQQTAAAQQTAVVQEPRAPQATAAPQRPEAVQETRTADPIAEAEPAEVVQETEAVPQPKTAEEPSCWDQFLSYQENDEEIELSVIGFNRGGLLVKWGDVVGFVPASQLCDIIVSGDESARQEAFSDQVGHTLTLKVIEVDSSRRRLILSERAARRVQEPDLSVLDGLLPGDVCPGTVTNLCSFGVFVDLGGIEGLIHISELSWGRVTHPSDVLQSGEEVDVYVLNVDRERGRVGLSLKRLCPDPWGTADSKFGIGEIFEGTITNIVNFGAFVRLEEGLEGLIHNSEWGDAASQQSVREGDVVQVRVISLDSERHRMGLSLERVTGGEAPAALA
jgi:small subunit ribosomal protein S1